ncbi:MAG: YbaK/EbsC family protein, partial [Alphaproteobacteria bacterium]
VELDASTRTAQDAANTIGCDVAQIVKSLVFQGKESGKPVMILVSGPNRVNESVIAEHFGEPIGRADPAYVR